MAAPLSFTAPRVVIDQIEKESAALPSEEREQALVDIYGTGKPIEETPEFTQSKINELKEALDAIPSAIKHNYLEAKEKCPDFVNSKKFALMFLRSESFDAKLSADRIIRYWDMKVRLFGHEVAFRPDGKIRLSDLNEDDLASLNNQAIFMLPTLDASNRGILYYSRQKLQYKKRESVARLAWYLVQVALEKEERIQTHGMIGIVYNDGSFSLTSHFDRKYSKLFTQLFMSILPLRPLGLHVCFDSKMYELALQFILSFVGKEFRARARLHGNKETQIEELAEFGLGLEALPTWMGGRLELDMADWQEKRKKEEENMENPENNQQNPQDCKDQDSAENPQGDE